MSMGRGLTGGHSSRGFLYTDEIEGWSKFWTFLMNFLKIDEQYMNLFEFYDGTGN
jgi:hypothetical protein